MFYLVLVNGLIDSLNPCAIGVLISYLALMVSLRVERKHFINFGIFYILATYSVYLLIGLGILRVLHLFGVHNFFGWVAAAVILILGLYNIKSFFWPALRIPYLSAFLDKCRIPNWKPSYTIFSALALGFLIGLCEFPCSGGIYLATISLLSAKTTFWRGLLYLLIYNFMFILPLLLIFATFGNNKVFNYLKQLQVKTFSAVKLIMGVSMLVSGALLLVWLIRSLM